MRLLKLTITDYTNKPVCNLYDISNQVSGQAEDVSLSIERNGWEEISFTLPGMCDTIDGQLRNYRLDYLIADYKIKLLDDSDLVRWFLITKHSISHSGYKKDIDVTAGSTSQMLKLKNLGLLFSDDEGNNVGNAELLLTTILEGTGWSVGEVDLFRLSWLDKDTTSSTYGTYPIKTRSLKCLTKTGAFKMITLMCDLFDAKPIYHTDSKIVDIVKMNPFSQPADGELPDVTKADGVFELHYGKNLKTLKRLLNTLNIVTKLYAYGSYGDTTLKYCSISECTHTVYSFSIRKDVIPAGTTIYFTVEDDSGSLISRHFVNTYLLYLDDVLKFSFLDPASLMYIYDCTNLVAYLLSSGKSGTELWCDVLKTDLPNLFLFMFDFDYYKKIGLFTDDMLQTIAQFQNNGGAYLLNITLKSLAMSSCRTSLSLTIGYVDFAKLDVESVDTSLSYCILKLNKLNYDDGCIYRTDYTVKLNKRFNWRKTSLLDSNGDPKNEAASIIYIIHDTDPVTWDKGYLKMMGYADSQTGLRIDDDDIDYYDKPDFLTIWLASSKYNYSLSDRFYIFLQYDINGKLGSAEVSILSVLLTLLKATKIATTSHPVIFSDTLPAIPQVILTGYGWWSKYFPKTKSTPLLYMCYGLKGDTSWKRLYDGYDYPLSALSGSYFYNNRTTILYRYTGSAWAQVETFLLKYAAYSIGTVIKYSLRMAQWYEGLPLFFTYTALSNVPLGRYYFYNGYGNYYLFDTNPLDTNIDVTTNSDDDKDWTLHLGDSILYDTSDGWLTIKRKLDGSFVLYQDSIDIYGQDDIVLHSYNIFDGLSMSQSKKINVLTGLTSDASGWYTLAGYSLVFQNVQYNFLTSGTHYILAFYGYKKLFISAMLITNNKSTTNKIKVPSGTYYVKISVLSSSSPLCFGQAVNYADAIIALRYLYLPLNCETSGDLRGAIPYIKQFADLADECYLIDYPALKKAQDQYNVLYSAVGDSLGDILRLGYWQKTDYVDGDLLKLYDDALLNLQLVCKPLAKYTVGFLDLFSSDDDKFDYNSYSQEGIDVKWPDLTIMSAIHIVDPLFDINQWAYLDKIQKNYSDPSKTSITINTKLNTLTQHSFTDVMTNIANVASTLSAKETSYSKSGTVSGSVLSNDLITFNNDDGTEVIKINKNGIYITNGLIHLDSDSSYVDSDGVINLLGTIKLDGENKKVLIGPDTQIVLNNTVFTVKQVVLLLLKAGLSSSSSSGGGTSSATVSGTKLIL